VCGCGWVEDQRDDVKAAVETTYLAPAENKFLLFYLAHSYSIDFRHSQLIFLYISSIYTSKDVY
jgi:hypothetical protein